METFATPDSYGVDNDLVIIRNDFMYRSINYRME